jgi:hypothetical protein
MNNDRNQGRAVQPQAEQKHPEEWQRDLNPNHLAGQNIGTGSDNARMEDPITAFHLRKRGVDLGPLDDEELKQVPILPPGERLQQGATYVDLQNRRRIEFTATGDLSADADHAFVPKDRVPYEIWNRLTGKEKPL